jgi:hypothetical protein
MQEGMMGLQVTQLFDSQRGLVLGKGFGHVCVVMCLYPAD